MKTRLLLAVLMVCLIGLATVAEEKSKNLIENPGFEQGLPSWGEIHGKVALDYDVVHQGFVSLKMDASKGKNYCRIASVPATVKADKWYRLSCYIKNDTAIKGDGFFIHVLQHKPGKVLG